MYNYNTTYGYGNTTKGLDSLATQSAGAAIWSIVAIILAIVGAFLVYFLFVKANKKYDNKFLTWLKAFLDFQKMLIEPILKISYIFLALLVTLESFALIGSSFLGFLLMLVVGNILVRVLYEVGMVTISIWQNTRDINKKMK